MCFDFKSKETGGLTQEKVETQSEVKVAQPCPALCDLMDYTVDGILQARTLEWVDFPFSRESTGNKDGAGGGRGRLAVKSVWSYQITQLQALAPIPTAAVRITPGIS